MKAAVLEGINQLTVKEVPKPRITPDEVLLKVDSCGICGSDLRIITGGNSRVKYPHVIGHEIAATVAAVGAKTAGFKIGDRVSLSADIPCGECKWCKAGLSNHCKDNIAFGHEYDGGFAEYLRLSKRIIEYGPVIVLPKTKISQDEFSLCEPLACCINGLELCRMGPGKNILIFGAGPVGCMIAILARGMNASKIVLCDTSKERLSSAEACKADAYVQYSELEKPGILPVKDGFDVVITACPSIEAQETALKHVKNRGIINLFGGLPPGGRRMQLDSNEIHYREITLLGSHGSTPRHHRMAVEMLLSGKIKVKGLISGRYPLARINEAIEEARNGISLKIVINP